jgi:two-component sensor histidine kinase
MSAVDDAIGFLDTELAIRNPQYEGLKDYGRLNIQPDTMTAVQDLLRRYDTRMGLLATTRDLLIKLRDDPALDVQQVSAAVHADLQDQEATIAAALSMFTPESVVPATALNLSAGPVEPK